MFEKRSPTQNSAVSSGRVNPRIQAAVARFVSRDELGPEISERAFLNRPSRAIHEVEVEMQVVDADKTQAEDLFGFDEMSDVGARETATGRTLATCFQRARL